MEGKCPESPVLAGSELLASMASGQGKLQEKVECCAKGSDRSPVHRTRVRASRTQVQTLMVHRLYVCKKILHTLDDGARLPCSLSLQTGPWLSVEQEKQTVQETMGRFALNLQFVSVHHLRHHPDRISIIENNQHHHRHQHDQHQHHRQHRGTVGTQRPDASTAASLTMMSISGFNCPPSLSITGMTFSCVPRMRKVSGIRKTARKPDFSCR